MVMDTVSPQCVGREFVRQYYTMMNEAPCYLYKFYSAKSTFIHGGVDQPGQESIPAMGVEEISKRVAELKFEDCRTVIRQVDSQQTVGGAVVVQVTGQLSNNGSVMRRFMQTFVLAQKKERQYYVHNDIFRYQDEVFEDTYDSEEEIEPVQQVLPEIQEPVVIDTDVTPEPEPPTPEPSAEEVAETNGMDENIDEDDQIDNYSTPPTEPQTDMNDSTVVDNNITETEETIINEVQTAEDNQGNKTFSWANVVGTKNQTTAPAPSVAVVTPMNKQGATVKPAPPANQQPEQEEIKNNGEFIKAPSTNKNRNSEPRQMDRKPPIMSRSIEDGGIHLRQNEKYPDEQQVFVGNLPQNIAQLELKKFFNTYGNVIDVRINRNSSNRIPFGFVVFDDTEAVKKLLKLPRVEIDGHRINVEKKIARSADRTKNHTVRVPNRSLQRGGPPPRVREHSGNRDKTQSRPFNKR